MAFECVGRTVPSSCCDRVRQLLRETGTYSERGNHLLDLIPRSFPPLRASSFPSSNGNPGNEVSWILSSE